MTTGENSFLHVGLNSIATNILFSLIIKSGRFDLRLPYADQGYVDEDADVMGKVMDFFGGGKAKKAKEAEAKALAAEKAAKEAEKSKKKGWPW